LADEEDFQAVKYRVAKLDWKKSTSR